MCDYSIAMTREWQKLSTLSLQLLQRVVVYHHYSSTYLLISLHLDSITRKSSTLKRKEIVSNEKL